MGSFFQRKGVRCFLAVFKWCRVVVLLAVLAVVAALTYLQLVGLPDFLKNPFLRVLRQRGFDAQFASARFGWGPSIVIENAAFSPTNQASGARLSAEWTQLDLNAAALWHARLKVDSFQILQASLRVPVAPTNAEPLRLTGVNLSVTLVSNNLAHFQDSSARLRGIHIHFNGDIRNFRSLRDWQFPVPVPPAGSQAQSAPAAPRLTAWQVLQTVQFTGEPSLSLHFYADGLDENTLRAELKFTAAGTRTPWGQSGPLHLRAVCARVLNSGDKPLFQIRFRAQDVTTPWAGSRDLSASIDFSRDAGTNLLADVHLAGHQVSAIWPSSSASNWIRVADLRWDGASALPSPRFAPATFIGTLKATQTESAWGSVGAASLVLQTRSAEASTALDPAWGQWNHIKPFTLDCRAQATNILTPKLKLDRVAFQAGWNPPQLTIDKLEAVMYHSHLDAGGVLNVASREVQARAAIDIDPHQISPLLSGPARHWISLYDWEAPPNVSAAIRFVLPPWTNRMGLWPQASQDSIQLAGDFSVGRGAFRGIAVTSAQTHFSYTNSVWNVSDLRVAGPGGSLGLDYDWSEATDAYHFRFDSKLDPGVALPLLTESGRRKLNQVRFLDKPAIQGNLWGNWKTPGTTGFAASLAAGRFIVRGENVNQLRVQMDYTNHLLRLSQLGLARDVGRVDIPLVTINLASNIFFLTNANSTIDPEPVRRALGKYAPPFMREVHFDSPPVVKASGSFVPGNDFGTAMHFVVQGDHFHWKGLSADSVRGEVNYNIRTVDLTNIQAGIYGGKARAFITIQWAPQRGTRFDADGNLKNIDLGALAREWGSKTSKIEGLLDGHLALGAPYDAGVTNLFGNGWLHVHNGLLWDFKIFGIFSPILNAIAPGSGNSRARQATATFIITNGVIVTDDLEIRSSGFRLLYRGTLDPQRRLNARVVANLLRDTPLFGYFLGWMLTPLDKLFEYRVTGTLQKPITQPVFIPKVFMALLRPFSTLKELLPPPGAAPAPAPDKPPK